MNNVSGILILMFFNSVYPSEFFIVGRNLCNTFCNASKVGFFETRNDDGRWQASFYSSFSFRVYSNI